MHLVCDICIHGSPVVSEDDGGLIWLPEGNALDPQISANFGRIDSGEIFYRPKSLLKNLLFGSVWWPSQRSLAGTPRMTESTC